MKRLKVAMIAPPWLAMPIKGYGGIEQVLQNLIPELQRQSVDVTLFANGQRKMKGVKTVSLFNRELFDIIHNPYYETASTVQAHMSHALNYIHKRGDFDIIHDHNTIIGPSILAYATQSSSLPPALHTFHGPPFIEKTAHDYSVINNALHLKLLPEHHRLKMVCISEAMSGQSPKEIRKDLLAAVHNAIDVNLFPFQAEKRDYYITLARFNRDKGHATAVHFAAKHKKKLRMAGTVSGIGTNRKLLLELANPMSSHRNNHEFKYFSDEILQYVLRYPNITYSGNVSGSKKKQFLAEAKALLFPIAWEEPFGMAVIEALACGTPVVAMRRGAMPEIIQHGVNGFLANSVEEFEEYALRVDEIDPEVCRKSVEDNFSASTMAANYIDRYHETIKLAD